MKLILKYKKEILAATVLIILYFLTRLILLGSLPIFTDEAIYVRWSQIAANDASWRFISLTDGKQPGIIWPGMILVSIINDPLVALRLVSVVTGFFTLVGLFILTYELFRNRLATFLATGIALLTTDSTFFSSFQNGKKIDSELILFTLMFHSINI